MAAISHQRETQTPPVPRDVILTGDACERLAEVPDGCVQCVVTSPPYFGLRSYLPAESPDKWREVGAETTVDEYVRRLVAVFREVRRVLRDDGVAWLNLGDSYTSGEVGRHDEGEADIRRRHAAYGTGRPKALAKSAAALPRQQRKVPLGLKPKNLIGVPWRVAFALQDDGWWLRADIVWAKANCMPESVTDRPTRAHEYIFLLAKAERYFYDADAIAEPATYGERFHGDYGKPGILHVTARRNGRSDADNRTNTRNRRDVWTIATEPYPGGHFAVMPTALVEPCVMAGTSGQACEHCGAPWARVVEKRTRFEGGSGRAGRSAADVNASGKWAGKQYGENIKLGPVVSVRTTGWVPSCRCADNTGAGRCLVLDPFMGSGTVPLVARRLGRAYLGVELNPEYVAMAGRRLAADPQPMLLYAPRRTREVSASAALDTGEEVTA